MNILLDSTTRTDLHPANWVFLGFFIISIITISISIFLIKLLIQKRKNYKRGFEAFGNNKYKYNLWNLWMVIFICFTGFIGALVSGGIFFSSIH